MNVRMTVGVTGTRDGADWPRRGEPIDLPADEALALIAAHMAEPVREDVPEAAVVAGEPETAAVRRKPTTRRASSK